MGDQVAKTTETEKSLFRQGSWLGPNFAGKLTQLPNLSPSEDRAWELRSTCLRKPRAKPKGRFRLSPGHTRGGPSEGVSEKPPPLAGGMHTFKNILHIIYITHT